MRTVGIGAALAAAAGIGYRLLVSGALTIDIGIGRRVQRLEPLSITIQARRETVFDVIAAPYLGRTPRALSGEIDVWERGTDMVLAAHRTALGRGRVTTTVETVRFERPEHVAFRLVRGPVPHVVEQFRLTDLGGSTRLDYEGELGTDFGALGQWWGGQVAGRWVATVRASLDRVRDEAERRATSSARAGSAGPAAPGKARGGA